MCRSRTYLEKTNAQRMKVRCIDVITVMPRDGCKCWDHGLEYAQAAVGVSWPALVFGHTLNDGSPSHGAIKRSCCILGVCPARNVDDSGACGLYVLVK